MNPTLDWLRQAEGRIREVLQELHPKLLETQGKIEHRLKHDKTAVTEMDTMVEDRLRQALRAYDASIPFGGEESGVDYNQKTFWLVDPIDGTEPFIRGMPFATNMIALIDNGEPIMGIVHNFALGEYYLAIKGNGSTCNGHPIHVGRRSLEEAFISVARAGADPRCFGLADRIRSFTGGGAGFNVGATGYTLTALASGGIEARVTYKSRGKPWDYAPGALILQEAGGRIGNIGADGYDYRNTDVVAANPVIFDELMQFMNEFAASKE